MRTQLKIFATLSICAVFYAGAFYLMQGIKEFEYRGNEALFTPKQEMAAIDNAEAYEATPIVTQPQQTVTVSPGIWK